MKRRIFLILLTFALCLVGCKKEEQPAGDVTVKIGFVYDYTNDAELASDLETAVKTAIDEINYFGGVLTEGLKLELITKDDKGTGLDAVAAYYQLKAEGACVVLGVSSYEGMKELKNVSDRENVPIITLTVTDNEIVSMADFRFQACPSDAYLSEALAEYAKESKIGKAAVIYTAGDEKEISMYEDFVPAALSRSLEIVYAGEMTDTDYGKHFEGIVNAGAEAVFVPGISTDFEQLFAAANKAGYEGIFLTPSYSGNAGGYDVYSPVTSAVDIAYNSVYYVKDAIEKGYLATPVSIALKLPFLSGTSGQYYYEIGAYGNTLQAVDIYKYNDGKCLHQTTVFD